MSSEADTHHTRKLLEGLECLVVQDIVMTETAEAADVVLPGTASWCESEGTVTNSERRVQRVRKAIEPPRRARDDIWIITELARRLGSDWGSPTPRGPLGRAPHAVADARRHELREDRAARRRPVALPRRGVRRHDVPARPPLGGRPGQARRPRPVPPDRAGRPARQLTIEYPIRLTTGRRLDSYNTGVATARISTPLRRPEALRPLARGGRAAGLRRRRVGAGHLAARLDRGPGAGRTRRCGRGWRS